MEPAFKEGERVLTFNFFSPQKRDVVVLKKSPKMMLKRVSKASRNSYFVLGDNLENSTDSRHFGPVQKGEIIGKVLLKY